MPLRFKFRALYRGKLVSILSTFKVNEKLTLKSRQNIRYIKVMDDHNLSILPPERLAISYLLPQYRDMLTLLLALNNRILGIYSNMNEVLMAQIRLAWWRDTIKLESKPKGEPLIILLEKVKAEHPDIIIEKILTKVIDGWEILIVTENNITDAELLDYAMGSGGTIFAAIANICDVSELSEQCKKLGAIWALSNLYSGHHPSFNSAKKLSHDLLDQIDIVTIAKKLRSLTILAYPAVYLLAQGNPNPKNSGFLYGISYIWHAISGRWSPKI